MIFLSRVKRMINVLNYKHKQEYAVFSFANIINQKNLMPDGCL